MYEKQLEILNSRIDSLKVQVDQLRLHLPSEFDDLIDKPYNYPVEEFVRNIGAYIKQSRELLLAITNKEDLEFKARVFGTLEELAQKGYGSMNVETIVNSFRDDDHKDI